MCLHSSRGVLVYTPSRQLTLRAIEDTVSEYSNDGLFKQLAIIAGPGSNKTPDLRVSTITVKQSSHAKCSLMQEKLTRRSLKIRAVDSMEENELG